jgi:hypothetical protein
MLNWKRRVSSSTDAASGDYRMHRSGADLITVYKINPFLNLGIVESVQAAMTLCESHFIENMKNEN